MGQTNEMNKYLRRLRQGGYGVRTTRGQHVAISHPSMSGQVFTSSTPSDRRALRNVQAMIKRKTRANQELLPVTEKIRDKIQRSEPRTNLQAAMASALLERAQEYAPQPAQPTTAAPATQPTVDRSQLTWAARKTLERQDDLREVLHQIFAQNNLPYMFVEDLAGALRAKGWNTTPKGVGKMLGAMGLRTESKSHPTSLVKRKALLRKTLEQPPEPTIVPVPTPAPTPVAAPPPPLELAPDPDLAFEPAGVLNEMLADANTWGLLQAVLRYTAAVTPSAALRAQYLGLAQSPVQQWTPDRVQVFRLALTSLPFNQIQNLLNLVKK